MFYETGSRYNDTIGAAERSEEELSAKVAFTTELEEYEARNRLIMGRARRLVL